MQLESKCQLTSSMENKLSLRKATENLRDDRPEVLLADGNATHHDAGRQTKMPYVLSPGKATYELQRRLTRPAEIRL